METELERDWSGSLLPSVDGCFCLVVRGTENLLNWRQLSPPKRTRGHWPVSWSSNVVLLWISWAGEQRGGRRCSCQGCELSECSPLCHTGQGRVIWRLWRSSFSAWLPWHLVLLCNYAEVEWWHGKNKCSSVYICKTCAARHPSSSWCYDSISLLILYFELCYFPTCLHAS